MRTWVTDQLPRCAAGTVVIVDPPGVVSEHDLASHYGEHAVVATVRSWIELRNAWEANGRRRKASDPPLILHVIDPDTTSIEALPWDIDASSCSAHVRIPVPASIAVAFASLDDPTAANALTAIDSAKAAPPVALLGAVSGRAATEPPSGAAQFDMALRLRHRPTSPEVLSLAQEILDDPLAQAVLDDPPRWGDVRKAWEHWLGDPDQSPWQQHVEAARGRLVDLFLEGVLPPSPATVAGNVPRWASVGVAERTTEDRVAALLESTPVVPITTFEEWGSVAQWWGELRFRLAEHGRPDSDLTRSAWERWSELDEAFLAWLDESYGAQLTRSWTNGPISLDKVQPYLAYQHQPGDRMLLIVMDGMGFAQWAQIRSSIRVPVESTRATLAMLPTLTEVSRQAIAAGGLPLTFRESIKGTHREPHRWSEAWADDVPTVSWFRIDGIREDEFTAIPIGSSDVIGVVLSIVDEHMHANELLGDIGLRTAIEAWMGSGILNLLLDRAAEAGYRIWMTADHGNLDCEPSKAPSEGQFAERAGTRVRRYASKTLRDHSDVPGHRRDSLPGYPSDLAEKLLFAPGRTGWGKARLSHGGLSFDEVIVPFIEFAL